MVEGYCTLEDVRRALREASLPGDLSQDNAIVVDAIAAKSVWLERTYMRHWYASAGDPILDEATEITIPQSAKTRDDEHDIPTHGAFVDGASDRDTRYSRNSDALLESGPVHSRSYDRWKRRKKAEIRIATGDVHALERPVDETVPAYTRIRLDRKDVDAINELHVINESGGYDDWVADSSYEGGVGTQNRGKDYWGRVNNEGVSELYLDVHSLDDEIASFSNAVYIDWSYGHEGIPRNVRRATALLAASDFVQEAAIEIPDNARIYNVETLAEQFERKAEELLEPDAVGV